MGVLQVWGGLGGWINDDFWSVGDVHVLAKCLRRVQVDIGTELLLDASERGVRFHLVLAGSLVHPVQEKPLSMAPSASHLTLARFDTPF